MGPASTPGSTNDPDAAGVGRRKFLKGLGAAGAAATGLGALDATLGAVPARALGPAATGDDIPGGVFTLGVASGDPTDDSVVLWTRAAPPPDNADVDVWWELATTPDFVAPLASGQIIVGTATDHCAKVTPTGLAADTWYYYRFAARGAQSPVGRTRTFPAPGSSPERVRFAVAGCQLYQNGFFGAYNTIATEDIDFVLFLGDYIYEYGGHDPGYPRNPVRFDPVDHPTTRAGFSHKYRLYRSEVPLQQAHQNVPFIAVWDDHELADNYGPDTPNSVKDAAYGTWFDYMPTNYQGVPDDPYRIFRKRAWGDLAEIFALDERQYRSLEPRDRVVTAKWQPPWQESQTMLGAAQKQWLVDGLLGSNAAWKVLGNAVMMTPLRIVDLDEPLMRKLNPNLAQNAGIFVNMDQWDGYQRERLDILNAVNDSDVEDLIVLTSDIHTWWTSSVPLNVDDPSSPKLAAEFVTSSLSSPGLDGEYPLSWQDQFALQNTLKRQNPYFDFINLLTRGYSIVEITPEACTVDYYTADIGVPDPTPEILARFKVNRGSSSIETL